MSWDAELGMEALTALVRQTPVLSYAPNRILGMILRECSAHGALPALREAEKQAAGAEKGTPSLSLSITAQGGGRCLGPQGEN